MWPKLPVVSPVNGDKTEKMFRLAHIHVRRAQSESIRNIFLVGNSSLDSKKDSLKPISALNQLATPKESEGTVFFWPRQWATKKAFGCKPKTRLQKHNFVCNVYSFLPVFWILRVIVKREFTVVELCDVMACLWNNDANSRMTCWNTFLRFVTEWCTLGKAVSNNNGPGKDRHQLLPPGTNWLRSYH